MTGLLDAQTLTLLKMEPCVTVGFILDYTDIINDYNSEVCCVADPTYSVHDK